MEEANQTMTVEVGVTYVMTSSYIERDDVITRSEKGNIAKPSSSSAALATQGVLYGTILFLGLLFNCCVIWLIRHKRPLHTISNMWVTSLCIAQLLICAISLPLVILSVAADDWLLGSVFCRIFGFYTTCFRTVSILSVAGIALDRHQVVTRPFSVRMRKSSARIQILLTWWSGVLASTPPLFGIGLYRYSPSSHMCAISWSLGGSALVFTVFYVTSVYVTSLMVISFAYKLIYKVTKAQANKRRRPSDAGGLGNNVARNRARSERNIDFFGSPPTNDDIDISASAVRNAKPSPARRRLTSVLTDKTSRRRSSLRHRLSTTFSGGYSHSSIDNRAALTIFLVLTTFICTWAPYFAFGLYSAVASGNKRLTSADSWTEFIITWLTFSNVIWDPLLYGALNHNFRAHLRDWWRSNANSRIFKFSGSKFRPAPSDDSGIRESSETVPANRRETIKKDNGKREKISYGRGVSYPEDSHKQMSESAKTMTSCECDINTSTSRQQSKIAPRDPTNSEVLLTSNDGTTEIAVHNLSSTRPSNPCSSLPRDILTSQINLSKIPTTTQRFKERDFEPRVSTQASLEKQHTAFTVCKAFHTTSRNITLSDVVMAQDCTSPSTNAKCKTEGDHSFRPLPMVKKENEIISSSLRSFRSNKHPPSRNLHCAESRQSSEDIHKNAAKPRSASQTETSFCSENTRRARSSDIYTLSTRDFALAGRKSTGSSGIGLSSENQRLRRQKVRSQPESSDFDCNRATKRQKVKKFATAL